ncbi:hypothetical protein [Parabacteroides bouchesdurhonensis]|uniref:hypothetical protein n=1 Tax=Parabacteroides bouchesdurhonensis TaxID=1936995 RepID=UPI000E481686|nr:hypothetical protein [Parabacteroides bouchesdurhonensis]RHJ91430.1 hypothetical protein DW095_10640 [Bacteroides sp. AM07-16]
MKPLILSFFAVLLGYSLFFDKEEDVKLRTPEQVLLAFPEANSVESKSDSIELYARKTNKTFLNMKEWDGFFF